LSQLKTILATIGKHYPVGDYTVMGKTGTARVVQDGRYSDKRHVYVFSGIVERGDYRRVIVTFVREPEKPCKWASLIAAPLFQAVAEKMILHEKGSIVATR